MGEWYSDFAAACKGYERLGHKIDALRSLCDKKLENVSSRLFNIGIDKPRRRRW
jgi:hypothetical protein